MTSIDEAFSVTQSAYDARKAGHDDEARALFMEGIRLFSLIAAALPAGDSKLALMKEEIERMRKIVHPAVLDQANEVCSEAIRHEKAQQIEQARDLYVQSAELYMRAHKQLEGDAEKQGQVHTQLCTIIERGETLKAALSGPTFLAQNATQPAAQAVMGSKAVTAGTGRSLTEAELAVLRDSSRVNGHICLPWLDSDLREEFSSRAPFEDDMLLELSGSQQPRFSRWARPPELHPEPRMIVQVSPQSVTQTVVTNCSFVCSLAVSAGYEARFRRGLIGSIVYPQNRAGTPVISPSGKYMVRLNFNGIARKVVVDDRLPVDRHNKLLTSFSKDPSEFWIPIIEKAFLKVMGMSYDFPGSSSHIDLYTLTGWIPEGILIDKDFDPIRTWELLIKGQPYGNCIVTCGSRPDTDESTGLVPRHAYAVLDVKFVCGKRLLLMKNPWSHQRWRGPFSPDDIGAWTPELQEALHYDVARARTVDNGVFWIDWESLCAHFGKVSVNWDPDLFKYHGYVHMAWPLAVGPRNDQYNLSENPQVSLEVNNDSGAPGNVWVLLSKHICDTTVENEDFVALHWSKSRNGKRVYYNNDTDPDKGRGNRGIYINTPHHLMRMDVPKGQSRFTLVASQSKRRQDLNVTVQAWSTVGFSMTPLPLAARHVEAVVGAWSPQSSGPFSASRNPNFRLEIPAKTRMVVKLLAQPEFATQITLLGSGNASQDSGSYRFGMSVLELDGVVQAGVYTLVVSTYTELQKGVGFRLVVETDGSKVALAPV